MKAAKIDGPALPTDGEVLFFCLGYVKPFLLCGSRRNQFLQSIPTPNNRNPFKTVVVFDSWGDSLMSP